ncbi:MAG: copper chaperone PCu(A)C [Pseudomonadota bacterium]
MNRFILLATLAALAACTEPQSPLIIKNLDVQRALPGTSMGRAYLTLVNTTDDPITITHVSSPDFGRVALHESVIEDGIARMRALDTLTIAAGDQVKLAPGGKHLMLHDALSEDSEIVFVFYAGDTPVLSVATRTDTVEF